MNITIFKKYYSKNFIDTLTTDYKILFKTCKKNGIDKYSKYFSYDMGKYSSGRIMNREYQEYFNNLIYPPNIYILYIILENINQFKNKIFIDYGSGINCFLSIFLKKIGITCYNYDNYLQIGDIVLDDEYYKKYDISKPIKNTDLIQFNKIDGILCSGIWINNKTFIEKHFDIALIDKCYNKDIKQSLFYENYLKQNLKTNKIFGEILILSNSYSL